MTRIFSIPALRALRAAIIVGLLLCGAPVAHGASKYIDEPDPLATRRVAVYLASEDCPGAVKALTEDLKQRHRNVLLLAGTMYETGLCVKENWEKAASFYQLADAAGHRAAIHRLAAGYAVAGRENALALWWAAHRPKALPKECIPEANPETEGAAFDAALERMPEALYAQCIYMVGVYSAITAETEFPAEALRHAVFGNVAMDFNPSLGEIVFTQEAAEKGLHPGVYDGRQTQLDDKRKIANSLLTYMRETGRRTLARYQKPEAISPTIRIKQLFSFGFK